MKSRISKRTRDLVLCAVISALGVLILFLGSLIDVLDLSAAMLASILCIAVMIEAGRFWPWLTYAATALLALLLLPNKFPSVIYLMTGYYPIVKRLLESLPRGFAWILKFVVFNVLFTAFLLICSSFFPSVDVMFVPALSKELNYALGYAVGNLVFLLYDIALRRIIGYYVFVLRDRLRIGKR